MQKSLLRSSLLVSLLAGTAVLAGCATSTPKQTVASVPDPIVPTAQYDLHAETMVKSINLRVKGGFSDNQRRALDQVASKASWMSGAPVDVEIVTANDPSAVEAGQRVGSYLLNHDVASDALSQRGQEGQPADIVTVNLVYYRAHVEACNQTWENLAATAGNGPYKNFGCAVTANLAAQIADPRDLKRPAAATPAEAGRRATVMDKYRQGQVTSSATDEQGKGTISDAIK
jgi:pilus assembly protein CpaD